MQGARRAVLELRSTLTPRACASYLNPPLRKGRWQHSHGSAAGRVTNPRAAPWLRAPRGALLTPLVLANVSIPCGKPETTIRGGLAVPLFYRRQLPKYNPGTRFPQHDAERGTDDSVFSSSRQDARFKFLAVC